MRPVQIDYSAGGGLFSACQAAKSRRSVPAGGGGGDDADGGVGDGTGGGGDGAGLTTANWTVAAGWTTGTSMKAQPIVTF